MTLYLASASPQRLALLQQLGWSPRLCPVYADEFLPDYRQFATQNPQAAAERELCHVVSEVARQKLLVALQEHRRHWLSSDWLSPDPPTEHRELASATKPCATELWLAADTLVAVRRDELHRDWAKRGFWEQQGQLSGQLERQFWLLLGKPRDESEAQNYLHLLSDTTQSVCSAIAFAADNGMSSFVKRLLKDEYWAAAGRSI